MGIHSIRSGLLWSVMLIVTNGRVRDSSQVHVLIYTSGLGSQVQPRNACYMQLSYNIIYIACPVSSNQVSNQTICSWKRYLQGVEAFNHNRCGDYYSTQRSNHSVDGGACSRCLFSRHLLSASSQASDGPPHLSVTRPHVRARIISSTPR